jgi:hypothetical protein
MKRIARDETRHAALAWRVASWIHGRLRAPERRRVLKAGRDAVEEIAIAVGRPLDLALLEATGLPGQAQAREMVAEMKLALWG